MSVALPALSWLADVKPRLVRYGSDLEPALGGPLARINRLGSRYAVDVALPTLQVGAAADWLAARLDAETQNTTLTLTWPSALYQSGLAPVVNGAGQAGSFLNVRGLTANAEVPKWTPLSFVAGGRNFLHVTRQACQADAGGEAVLPIGPMMRGVPADGAAVSFAAPTIEGFASGTTVDWELQLARWHKISFTLTENA